jgi:hypothetical protein
MEKTNYEISSQTKVNYDEVLYELKRYFKPNICMICRTVKSTKVKVRFNFGQCRQCCKKYPHIRISLPGC